MCCISVHVYGSRLCLTMDGISFDFAFQTSLLIEIPPYRNQRISNPVQVNFYVCNGKRKRSQYQGFAYVPANGKLSFIVSVSVSLSVSLYSKL